jgi:membrane carboxypeptidase/penicillin-binding protein PbpC
MKKVVGFFLLSSMFGAFLWAEHVRTFPDPRANVRVLDREGILLAQESSLQYGLRKWVPLSSVSPTLIEAVLQQEDRRFYRHPGLDPLALGRALVANLQAGRWVQGGSTVTQQLAKILLENWRGGRVPRTIFWKAAEGVLALDCELRWSKREILERYLNSVYLGRRFYGVEVASQGYFGKSAGDLTGTEAEILASRIRRPNQLRNEEVRPDPVALAPHLAQMLRENLSPSKFEKGDLTVSTTVDAGIQAETSEALRREIERLRGIDPKVQGAAVVIDVETGELRALVGSAEFSDPLRAGMVNHATALRQPGSTLKPFTYFLAFLHGRNPASLVLDAPYHFYLGDEKNYVPQNFDKRFHGVLSIREALGNSFNIPAVLTLAEMGSSYYLDLLHRFGFSSLTESSSYYGLALTLGSGAVTLVELTNAYAALARGGEYRPLVIQMIPDKSHQGGISPSEEERRAAFLVTNILSDPEARRREFGDAELMNLDRQPVAIKTGTSHDSRDAWAVGYTPRYAVGVWTGHSDNSPMPGFTGAEAAVPIWHAVMAKLHQGLPSVAFQRPSGLGKGTFCEDEDCRVVKTDWSVPHMVSNKPTPVGPGPRQKMPEESLRILSPADGDHFLLDPRLPSERQQIYCEIRLPSDLREAAQAHHWPIRWLVNGREVVQTSWDDPKTFLKLLPGRHELQAEVGETKTRVARLTVSEMK